jgi:hypothetical protein
LFGRARRRWEDNIRMDWLSNECVFTAWYILKHRDNFTFTLPYNSRVGSCGLDSFDSWWGPVAVSREHDNEPSGSIKGWEFIDQLSDY